MVKIEIGWDKITILLHDLPHVIIKKELLTGVHSWIEGYENSETFHIEYHMSAGANIISEYWSKEHWTQVLVAIGRADLFSIS